MIRNAITPAAYAAIAATLPSSRGVEQQRAPNGDYYIWLDPRYVDRLRAMREPGESYSDVILRLAEGGLGSRLTSLAAFAVALRPSSRAEPSQERNRLRVFSAAC